MKKKFITFAAICLAAIACTKETPVTSDKSDSNAPTVTANIVDEDDTKTHLNGLNVTWSSGDQIKVISHDDWLTSSKPYGTYTLATGAGTKSATFQMTSGSAPVVTTSNKFFAYSGTNFYSFGAGGSSTSTNFYLMFTIPSEQTYVDGGVSDGLLSMLGYGTSLSNIQFQHCCGIFTFKLYTSSSTPVQISKIAISSSTPIAGVFYHDSYKSPTGNSIALALSKGKSYDVNCSFSEPLTLSTTESSPTEVMIVLPAITLPLFNVYVYDDTNTLVKVIGKSGGNIVVKPGTKHVFPAFDVDPAHPYPSDATIKIGEDEPVSIYSYTGVPSGNVKINSSTTLTTTDISQIVNIVNRSTASSVSLDLSSVDVPDNIFKDWFVSCTSLTNIVFPNTITQIGNSNNKVLPTSLSGTIIIPDGVTSVYPGAFQYCTLASIHIPQSLTSFGFLNNQGLGVVVDDDNPNFSSSDGVLFNKDKTQLLFYPAKDTHTEYTIPSTVTEVGAHSFQGAYYLEELTIPSTVAIMHQPFSSVKCLNTITLQGCSTNIDYITYNDSRLGDSLFPITNGTINAPSGCSYYRNHSVWAKLNAVLGWTFNDGCGETKSAASIGPLGSSNPEIEW